jgi:hypothetical protein
MFKVKPKVTKRMGEMENVYSSLSDDRKIGRGVFLDDK